MPVTLSTSAKNARAAATMATIDGGSGVGVLVLGTSALSGATGVVASISLQEPSFSIAAGVSTALGVPLSAIASANGPLAKAEIRDSAGNVIVSGLTVGTSGTDVIVASTAVIPTNTIQITALTITE